MVNIKARRSAESYKKNQEYFESFMKQFMNMNGGGRGNRQGQRRPDQMQQNQAQTMFNNFGRMNQMGMGGAPMGMGMNPVGFLLNLRCSST